MRIAYLSAILATTMTATATQAQQAGSIDLGGFELTPAFNYKLRHDNNVTSAADNEVKSWVNVYTPSVVLSNDFGANRIQFGYKLQNADYFSSQTDNYTDHFLNAKLDLELNSRHRLDMAASWEDGHDDRGTRFSIGNGNALSEPDQYKNSDLRVIYSYGALTSRLGIDLLANYETLDYDLDLAAYRARDRDTSTLGTTLRYEIAPLTKLTLDYSHKIVDYDFAINETNPLGSTEDLVLLGIDWESSAQTTGYAKLGYRQKDFDAEQRDKFTGVDWQVGIRWEPVSYSRMNLTTYSNTNETNGEGNFIKSRTVQASWHHNWLQRLSSHVRLAYDKNNYEGAQGATLRSDDNISVNTGLSYDFRRWMVIKLDYIFDTRDSTRDDIDYDREQVNLSVSITL